MLNRFLQAVVCAGSIGSLIPVAPAQIQITNTSDPALLGNALFPCGGYTLISTTVYNTINTSSQTGTGLYTLGPLPNNYGITRAGIVISTGVANWFQTGPNTSPSSGAWLSTSSSPLAQTTRLNLITNCSCWYDACEVMVTFSAPVAGPMAFDVTFGSDEYPEFVNTNYSDGFALVLNGVNIARLNSLPIDINNTMAQIVETGLDGVVVSNATGSANFRVTGNALAGSNTLALIVGDRGDGLYDSAAYISAIRPVCPPAVITQQPQAVTAGTG